MNDRSEVYGMISDERDYQQMRWMHKPMPDSRHNIADWVLFMEHHLAIAKEAIYQLNPSAAGCEIRKVAALAVACMECKPIMTRQAELAERAADAQNT